MNKQKRTLTLWLSRLMVLPLVLVLCGTGWSATRTWSTTSGTGDWSIASNWMEGFVPTNGDDAYITNAGSVAILSSASSNLNSLTIGGGASVSTLMFTNWNSILTASNVTILSKGTVTLPAAFTNNQTSNNVYFVCTNFTIANGGQILADGMGYAGRTTSPNGLGYGPGAGSYVAGGGYGGQGGYSISAPGGALGGQPYGAANAPLWPGSGGGGGNYPGSAGGGAIRIAASGDMTINGTLTANGLWFPEVYGGGSGGAIFLTCSGTFYGSTSGLIRADGGAAVYGGGGGGRIAVQYGTADTNNQVHFSASYGAGGDATTPGFQWWYNVAGVGTLYLPDTALLSQQLDARFHNLRLIIPGFTNWSMSSLTVSNTLVGLGENSGFALTVTNDLQVVSGGELVVGGMAVHTGGMSSAFANTNLTQFSVQTLQGNLILNNGTLTLGGINLLGTNGSALNVQGNVTLTNGGALYVYGGMTNAAANYGAWVGVTGTLSVYPSSWVYPSYSQSNNNSQAVLFHVGNLWVGTNAGFNADGRGYWGNFWGGNNNGLGPGGGGYVSGGGYGGKGGDYPGYVGGHTYGSSNMPVEAGSGGGGNTQYPSYAGGGVVRVETPGAITLNGTITANGTTGAGGGSGGGIFLNCRRFTAGTNAIVKANGGIGTFGGGGGGRIAVRAIYWSGIATMSATNGTGGTGPAPGTVVLFHLPVPGTIFYVH